MRKFYLFIQKGQTLSAQLSWSHFVELLKFDDIDEINYYISISINQKLGVRELRFKIKNKECERLEKKLREEKKYE